MSTEKDFLELARERWSVRRFAPEQVSQEHMEKILEAGRMAPSACNYQPQRIFVLQSDEAIAKIRSFTHWAFNAPTVLMVCADVRESWKNVDGHDSAEVDAAIALTHIMMEAWELGVGTTWVRGFDANALSREFDLPDYLKPVALMPMGYPAPGTKPSNWHWRRKASEDLYRFI